MHPLLAQHGATSIPLRRPVIPSRCSSRKLLKRTEQPYSRPRALRAPSSEVTGRRTPQRSGMGLCCCSFSSPGRRGQNPLAFQRVPGTRSTPSPEPSCAAERRKIAQRGQRPALRSRAVLEDLHTTMTDHHELILGPRPLSSGKPQQRPETPHVPFLHPELFSILHKGAQSLPLPSPSFPLQWCSMPSFPFPLLLQRTCSCSTTPQAGTVQ